MPSVPRPSHPAGSIRRLAAAALLALLAPAPALSQDHPADDTRSVQALRMPADAEIHLDGRLREPFWDEADVATDFRQQEPHVGKPATETTRVRVAYDDENLYIGAVLLDSEPGGVLAYKRKRDAGLDTDDRFMWILDTFLDERTAYFFEINPAGSRDSPASHRASGYSSGPTLWASGSTSRGRPTPPTPRWTPASTSRTA